MWLLDNTVRVIKLLPNSLLKWPRDLAFQPTIKTVPVTPGPCQHLVTSVGLVLTIITVMEWHLIVFTLLT